MLKYIIRGIVMLTTGLKQIGKGAFTVCYKKDSRSVILKTKDPTKECMSHLFPKHNMFPKTEYLDTINGYHFYKQKYHKKVRSIKNNLTPSEYEFYKELRSLFLNFTPPQNSLDLYFVWYKKFESLPNKFHRKKELLLEALDALSNYNTDICFEISPRNIAIHNKRLVLLDCFFFKSKLEKEMKKRLCK